MSGFVFLCLSKECKLEEKRLVFVGLDQDGYPVTAQELVDGEWVPVSTEAYYGIPNDVYLAADSADSEDLIWTDSDSFAYDTCVEAGDPPSPEEANSVYEAYLQNMRSKKADAQLDGLVFVYEVTAAD